MTTATELPIAEGRGSVSAAPNLPAGFTDTFTSRYIDAGAVRLLLEQARERPAAAFDLTGRPQLLAVQVPPPDLTAYGALTARKGVRR